MKLALCTNKSSPLYTLLTRFNAVGVAPQALQNALDAIEVDASDLCFLDRGFCETQPYFKQIIPYVVLIRRAQIGAEVLTYVRGSGSNEERLKNKLSVGFGGHMDDVSLFCSSLSYQIFREASRELQEELPPQIREAMTSHFLDMHSVLLDEASPVNSVHLGILMTQEVEAVPQDTPVSGEVDTITEMRWVPLTELYPHSFADDSRLEDWSKIAVQRIALDEAFNGTAVAGDEDPSIATEDGLLEDDTQPTGGV